MTVIAIPAFQGMAPRFADALLGETQASFAANLQPTSGKLMAFRSPLEITRLEPVGVYRRVKKIYKVGTNEFTWFKSLDVNADVVRSPLAQDAYDRIYFTEAGRPPQVIDYNSLAAGNRSYNLGQPRPTQAPSLTVNGGGGTQKVAAYVYTTVSVWGEESPPSPPEIVTAYQNADSVTVTIPPGGIPGGATDRVPLAYIDIYRSLAGDLTSGEFFRVGRIDYGTWTFTDTMNDPQLSLQVMLNTYNNDIPATNMEGLTQHSSGALVGFHDRTVYFSIPYLPHAWPQDTQYVVPHPIVGLAAISNAIVVLTRGHPTILSGNTPDTIQIVNMTDFEPCMSKRSIVSVQNRALYASPNGLMQVSVGGLEKITNNVVTRREWAQYEPAKLVADVYGSYYIGFISPTRGICIPIPPYEPTCIIVLDRYSGISGVDTDSRNGDMFFAIGDVLVQFDGLDDRRFPTTWRSKEFIQPRPLNFGAIQVLFVSRPETNEQKTLRAAAETYNEARFAAGPLDTFDMYPIGGAAPFDYSGVGVPVNLQPPPGNMLGGEPLYDLATFGGLEQVRVTVIGDEEVRYTKVVTDGKVRKMPSGYKATRWYIELSGTAEIDRVLMAETGKELARA